MVTKQQKLEEAMARLSEIVASLEKGATDLDTALKLYEEGVSLVRLCSDRLDKAEQKVKLLRVDADGKVAAEPFSAEDTESGKTGGNPGEQ